MHSLILLVRTICIMTQPLFLHLWLSHTLFLRQRLLRIFDTYYFLSLFKLLAKFLICHYKIQFLIYVILLWTEQVIIFAKTDTALLPTNFFWLVIMPIWTRQVRKHNYIFLYQHNKIFIYTYTYDVYTFILMQKLNNGSILFIFV